MRVLLTGATGFVGQALLPCLAARGHDVVPVVRGESGLPGAVRWDLGREQAPENLPGRIDAVVHAAQSRNHRDFPKDGPEMFAVNTAGTAALLDYAARTGASRFCFLSTGTVYEPFDHGLAEDTPLAPTSMLGASKLAGEIISRPYASLFPLALLRIFTPYGPGQVGRLIPNLIGRVRSGQAVQVSTDGEGMRLAPIYVDDLCAVVMAAVERAWNGTFNVAAPRATTIREVVEYLASALGRKPVIEIGAGVGTRLVPPLDRLQAVHSILPSVPLADGLRRCLQPLEEPYLGS